MGLKDVAAAWVGHPDTFGQSDATAIFETEGIIQNAPASLFYLVLSKHAALRD